MIFKNLREKKLLGTYYLSGGEKGEIYIFKQYFKILVKIQNLIFSDAITMFRATQK